MHWISFLYWLDYCSIVFLLQDTCWSECKIVAKHSVIPHYREVKFKNHTVSSTWVKFESHIIMHNELPEGTGVLDKVSRFNPSISLSWEIGIWVKFMDLGKGKMHIIQVMNSDLYKKNPNSIILNISHWFPYRLLKSQLVHNHVDLWHNGRNRAFQLNNLSG